MTYMGTRKQQESDSADSEGLCHDMFVYDNKPGNKKHEAYPAAVLVITFISYDKYLYGYQTKTHGPSYYRPCPESPVTIKGKGCHYNVNSARYVTINPVHARSEERRV